MTAPSFHALTIADIRPETAAAISVSFTVPEKLAAAYHYTAGQYLTLRATIDGEEVRRSYSICTAPDDGDLGRPRRPEVRACRVRLHDLSDPAAAEREVDPSALRRCSIASCMAAAPVGIICPMVRNPCICPS